MTLTASEEGVWITDKGSMTTFKWDEGAKRFDPMGSIKAADIVVGVPGQVIVRNWANDSIYTKQGL